MNQNTTIRVPMSSVAKRMELTATIETTGMRMFRARMWCGIQLIKLAAIVMGVGIRVETPKRAA